VILSRHSTDQPHRALGLQARPSFRFPPFWRQRSSRQKNVTGVSSISAIFCSRPAETRFAFFVLLHLLEREADALGEAGSVQPTLQPQRGILWPISTSSSLPGVCEFRFAFDQPSPSLPTLCGATSAGRQPASETMASVALGENWLPKSSIRQAARGGGTLSERDAANERPTGPLLLERLSWDDLRVSSWSRAR
jgi:hypothetical protein